MIFACTALLFVYVGLALLSWTGTNSMDSPVEPDHDAYTNGPDAKVRQDLAELRAEGEAAEADKYAKLITIDEIPPVSDIKGVILLDSYYVKPFGSRETPSLITAERFEVIGDPNEVGKIIDRNIPLDWVISGSNDVKRITDDFRNTTKCKDVPRVDKSSFLKTLLAPFYSYRYGYDSHAWDHYTFAKCFGVPIKDYYWFFYGQNMRSYCAGCDDPWGWAIFVTETKGYALKYAVESGPCRIYGPDYYSRRVYKDLMLLRNKAKEKKP